MTSSRAGRRILVLMLVLLAACGRGRTDTPYADRSLIELAEIEGSPHPNAFALIQALRPHWLEVRGSGTGAKRVYLDGMDLGGVNLLRQIATPTIGSIEYFDGPAATQRWGMDHAAGVIQVRSRTP